MDEENKPFITKNQRWFLYLLFVIYSMYKLITKQPPPKEVTYVEETK